jgi:hypothetical protein
MCRSFLGIAVILGYNRYISESCEDCIDTAADETHSLSRLRTVSPEMESPVQGGSQIFLSTTVVREKDVSLRKGHRYGSRRRITDDQIVAPCDRFAVARPRRWNASAWLGTSWNDADRTHSASDA